MTAFFDLASGVAELSAEVEQLRATQLRAEAAAAAAQGEYDRALAKLTDEFGISSLEEARALLSQLDDQVAEQLAQARASLTLANGVT